MSVAHPRTPLETVIDALAARGRKPRGNDQGWASQCPAHDDHNPSLSISKGNQGVVLHCHAGCTPEAVVAALGLNLTDLFDPDTRTNGHQRQIQDTYNYTDQHGNLLFQTVRYVPKDFRQRRPDGHGGWLWNLQGVKRVLYRLPEVIAAVQARQRVWVVEGEKDVDALVKAGAVATCNPMGADSGTGNKWLQSHTAVLAGADVVVVADRDDQGRRHAQYVASQLEAAGCTIHLVEAMTGKDAASHLAAGHQLAEFVLLNPDESTDEPDDQINEPARDPTSWKPVDLTDALAGTDIKPPELWHRSDNIPLIYMGRVHWFQGESESCKSWAAQIVVAAQLTAGQHVLYIDYEDDDRGVVARLLALGTSPEAIAAHLTYIRPDEALRDRHGRYTDAWLDLVDVLDTRTYTLCVIDGVTEAMTTEGLELLSNTDIAAWMRLIPKRISSTGAAVVCIDHVTKNGETQGRYAIGGQHKLAGVTGAAYRFTALRPLSRATGTDPVTGTVAVTVMKDRPGYVRGRSPEGKVGTLSITAYPDGGVTAVLNPHGSGPTVADMAVAGRILTYLATYDGSSKTRIEQTVEGKAERIREALIWLVDRRWVRVQQKGQSHIHWLTDEGRSEVPDT